LPSLLAGLGLVAATYWLGRRLFGTRAGLGAGLMTATMLGVFSLARSPTPDMSLSLAVVAAVGAFASAELEGRRRALIVFYLLVSAAFWIKGPAGVFPLAVAVIYELLTHGWRGAWRLITGEGLAGAALLVLVVAAWCALALAAGGQAWVRDVVMSDYLRPYALAGSWGRLDLLSAFMSSLTSSLPWSLLLPVALWGVWTVEPPRRPQRRLALVWAAVVIVIVALSHRQRSRYHLPVCVPLAVLLAGGLDRLPWRARHAAFVVAGLVVATGLVVGQSVLTARQRRASDWQAIARAVAGAPTPLFALDVPELVFEFYLERPVLVVPTYETFARQPGAHSLLARERDASLLRAAADVHAKAAGQVAGRRYVLVYRD
jgi:4-amino-4-deoxy-L-arabinose transferase-like glycosyltransferase